MKLKIISNFLKRNFPLGIILFVHLPFFLFGKSSYIEILDNLNAEFIYNHLLAISDNIFNVNQFDKIENVINGWSLLYIPSQFINTKVIGSNYVEIAMRHRNFIALNATHVMRHHHIQVLLVISLSRTSITKSV